MACRGATMSTVVLKPIEIREFKEKMFALKSLHSSDNGSRMLKAFLVPLKVDLCQCLYKNRNTCTQLVSIHKNMVL